MSCGGSGGCGGGFTSGGGLGGNNKVKSYEEMNAFEHVMGWFVLLGMIIGGFAIATSADGALPPVESAQVEVRQ